MDPMWPERGVHTRADFVTFLEQLARSARDDESRWENGTIDRFLEAWAAWVNDMDGYFANIGEPVPDKMNWGFISQMLLAARIYE